MLISKSLTLLLIVFVSMLIAGTYGAMHDQLTYSISHEYYTKFKFYQFGILDDQMNVDISNPRVSVAIVGFLATWWTGFWIGLILGLVGLVHPTWKEMLRVTCRGLLITLVIAFFVGLLGLLYGLIVLAHRPRSYFENWYIPDNVVDLPSYIAVGSMHNFSYLGGGIGLIVAAIYSIRKRKRERAQWISQAA